jgi:exopolysaccharide biosynthesis polyprenyl glycosylphosphotransferase
VLRLGDAIALFVGFSVPLLVIAEVSPVRGRIALTEAAIVTVVGLWSMGLNGLWSAQVTSIRSVEFTRLMRALATLSVACLVLDRKSATVIRVHDLVLACVLGLVALVVWRSAFRVFMAAERRRGRNVTKVLIIGTGRQAHGVCRLFTTHPELGYRVEAVVGEQREAARYGIGALWRGGYADARGIVRNAEAGVVVLCASEFDNAQTTELLRDVRATGRTLYVDPGLSGIDFRRMHATAIGHQPLLEMTSVALSEMQSTIKRVFDVAVAGIVVVLTLPLMAVIATVIQFEDRGPVLFRQRRVGMHGAEFEILKFRTMVVDAEARLAALRQDNERMGPLFKMDADPRITRIGKFLRATSLDELPQLLNVLNGTMSLVGPRPALPREVAEFPAELNARHQVRPGITGLWQVEARDNPAFEAYVRLDLFYVDNWSIGLDSMILLGTIVEHIALRPLVRLAYRDEDRRRREALAALDVVRDEGVAVV